MAKKAKKKVAKKAKRKVGKPKRVFTDAQIKKMKKLALNGCQNNTIASIMGIPVQTIVDNFREVLTKKRAERKNDLRTHQNTAAKKGNPALLIFLGKNELDQADKQDIDLGLNKDTITLLGLIDGSSKGKLPTKQEDEDAR
jgi:hypothetical protein